MTAVSMRRAEIGGGYLSGQSLRPHILESHRLVLTGAPGGFLDPVGLGGATLIRLPLT